MNNNEGIAYMRQNNTKNIITNLILFILIGFVLYATYKTFFSDYKTVNTKSIPVASLVSIESNNPNNKFYAEKGDIVSLKMIFNDELASIPKVLMNGEVVETTGSKNEYVAKYTVKEQYENDLVLSFEILEYKNKKGKQGEVITYTSDNSNVIIKSIASIIPKVLVSSIALDKQSSYITVDGEVKLNAMITPINAANSEVTWFSSNPKVATVADGLVTGKKSGVTVITAVAGGKATAAKIIVTKEDVKLSDLKLTANKKTINIGERLDIDAIISPKNATDVNVIWSSSNPSVATVVNDVVYGRNPGTTTIEAKVGDIVKTFKVTVNKTDITASKITLNTNNLYLVAGDKTTLKYSIYPLSTLSKDVSWSSSNSEIVSVDSDGTVKAKKAGTATITVSFENVSATANVFVTNKEVSISSINLNKNSETICVGEKTVLYETIFPSNVTDKRVSWSSNNPSVATVSNGVVTAKGGGTATITVKSGNIFASAIIIVKPKPVVVQSVKINPDNATIYVGDTYQFSAIAYPEIAVNNTITWETTNTDIISISNGLILAKKAGIATIVATSGGKSATATIIVKSKPIAVTGIKLNATNVTITKGKSYTLTATVSPTNATNKTVTWKSSNPSVATVSNGVVTANGIGTATITATSGGKIVSATISVTNSTIAVTGIKLNATNATITKGKSYTLTATVSPTNATNKTVTWKSSNPSVATVSNGVVTANGVGTVTIIATSGGKSATATINVIDSTVSVTGIKLNATNATITKGKSYTLTATVSPTNATNKTVTWKSSNPSVATVSNGVVTANGVGTVTITATSGGRSATATINVIDSTVSVTGIKLNTTNKTIYYNSINKTTLTATVSPTNATNKTVTWKSSNPSVATVSSGVITPVGVGTTEITAEAGGKIAKATITVKKRVIFVIGASQVYYMAHYGVDEYKSSQYVYKYNHSSTNIHQPLSNSTLFYIEGSGKGMDWQTGFNSNQGMDKVNKILDSYVNNKNLYEIYLYFPLIGNSILHFACDNSAYNKTICPKYNASNVGLINQGNSEIKQYVEWYDNAYNKVKAKFNNTKAYVISMHPVRVDERGSHTEVVINTNDCACAPGYRSNWKYYKFNTAIKNIIQSNTSYKQHLTYIPLFSSIMETSNERVKFGYKVYYHTKGDGIHWDLDTTKNYVKMMLDYTGGL